LEASDGKLYGACGAGGPIGTGCLFRLNKDGSNFEVIYNFPSLVDGYSPTGSLVEDAGGFLYGTTLYSYSGYGVVFRINKNGSGYAVLKVFNPGDPELLYGGVKLSAGYLYGIGYFGGASGYGGVFRIHTDGTGYELLHSFDLNIDGSYPFSSAVVSNGKLYGTTTFGGSSNYGTIYSMDISGMNFTVLRDLAPGDVQSLQHGIIVSSDGALYGAGYTNTGTAIFRMNANGSNYSILKTFDVIAEGQSATSLLETNNVSLPVTLTKFQVQRKNETAWITWETAQEANSKSFEIERSGNGNEFNNIGSVNARGNSNTTTSYSFSDDSPIKGMNYYRLKQLDNDGKFSYSSIKSIAFNKESNLIVYPNPAIDKIQLRLSSAYRNATVELMNSEGRILQKFNIANVDLVQLNMNSFPAGNYILRVSTNSESETVSFIKMKK
jgi:uncharacterized repeat protein (TIGR03803 family)